MELYKEILVEVLSRERAEVRFPGLEMDAEKMVETVCYRALCRIRDIIRDDSLSDKECFHKIEEIICTLEELGSDGGDRHDFG